MTPSVLQELKEGRFRRVISNRSFDLEEHYYLTESKQTVFIWRFVRRRWRVRVNGKPVSWFFGWKIRRAIKKGVKRND